MTAPLGIGLGIAALSLWALAYGAYLWPDMRRWWRARHEPAESRMLRAHAEWVRRTRVTRPPLPRRVTAGRPTVLRPTVLRPAAPATPPVATPARALPSNVIPFPNLPGSPKD